MFHVRLSVDIDLISLLNINIRNKFECITEENISSIYVSQKFHRIPTDIRENATHIVLFSGGGSIRKLADIISPYTDADPHKASKVLDGYLRQKEFVVIDINKPRFESFSLRWDTPLNLEREIKSLGNTSN